MLSTTAARSILSRAAVKSAGRTKKYSTATTLSIQRLLSSNQKQSTPSSSLVSINFSTDILNETLQKAQLYEQRSELIRRIKSDLIEADVNTKMVD